MARGGDLIMTIDFTKPVQTRSGKPVRIICMDRQGDLPIVGLLKIRDNYEIVNYWLKNGSYLLNQEISPNDLVNVPKRHKHADLMIAYANDTSLVIEWKSKLGNEWAISKAPIWDESYEYRIKPR